MSDIQNIILDTSTGLIHKIKREHLYVHFNIVSGDSVIKIVSGDSVITIVSGFPRVLLFSSFYNGYKILLWWKLGILCLSLRMKILTE